MTPTNPPNASQVGKATTGGFLIVLNGRMKGARRPLNEALTLIGQAANCEVRLNVDSIRPYHCGIIKSPEGYFLRDLTAEEGTTLNGQIITQKKLCNGDTIDVGPFQFQIECPVEESLETLNRETQRLLIQERDGLRIQAAAIAAQHAGLIEEEVRLEKRHRALHHQEEELSLRLEARQRELREQEDRWRQEQQSWEKERSETTARFEQQSMEINKTRLQLDMKQTALQRQEQRLKSLRQRLKSRWQQFWEERKKELGHREQILQTEQAAVRSARDNLTEDQIRLQQSRLSFSVEMEKEQQQLQEHWLELSRAQQEWEQTLQVEQGERNQRLQALEAMEAASQSIAKKIQQEKQDWIAQRASLEYQIHDLKNRRIIDTADIRSIQLQQNHDLPDRVKQLAGVVADQRWHITEQWHRLLEVQENWNRERGVLLGELEAQGRQLQHRELRLNKQANLLGRQEQILKSRIVKLESRHQELSQMRSQLESFQAQIFLQVSTWEQEKQEFLGRIQGREEQVAHQMRKISQFQKVRKERLRHHARQLNRSLYRTDQVRKQYITLWNRCKLSHRDLLTRQQLLDRQTLALDLYRSEYLEAAEDPVVAERRLKRLERTCRKPEEDAERLLAPEWQALADEMTRLEEKGRELTALEQSLIQRSEELALQQADLEEERFQLGNSQARYQQELERERLSHQQDQRLVFKLQDEVERLARVLLDEVDKTDGPSRSPDKKVA